MSERFDQLQSKHRELQLRSALQRRALGEIAQSVEASLSGVDRGLTTVRNIARRPAIIVGALGALTLVGPRRLLAYASRGAMLWATARNLLRATRDPSRD